MVCLFEDYYVKLLSTKVYWDNTKDREEFKTFWNQYKEICKLKETNFIEYVRQKEILFIKNDMKKIEEKSTKTDYSKLITYYKRKLIDYGAMRELKNNYKSVGKYTKKLKEVA